MQLSSAVLYLGSRQRWRVHTSLLCHLLPPSHCATRLPSCQSQNLTETRTVQPENKVSPPPQSTGCKRSWRVVCGAWCGMAYRVFGLTHGYYWCLAISSCHDGQRLFRVHPMALLVPTQLCVSPLSIVREKGYVWVGEGVVGVVGRGGALYVNMVCMCLTLSNLMIKVVLCFTEWAQCYHFLTSHWLLWPLVCVTSCGRPSSTFRSFVGSFV